MVSPLHQGLMYSEPQRLSAIPVEHRRIRARYVAARTYRK
jgi:hypothetical protein